MIVALALVLVGWVVCRDRLDVFETFLVWLVIFGVVCDLISLFALVRP